MSTLRIFNLTDVETPLLQQHHAVNSNLAVGRELVPPGHGAEVEDDPMTRAHLEHYLKIGAICVGKLPGSYMLARTKMDAEKKGGEQGKEKSEEKPDIRSRVTQRISTQRPAPLTLEEPLSDRKK